MSTGYKISEKDGLYYLTFQIVGWVDVFSRQVYKDIAIDSFKYCQKNKGLELFAYVIMSNHIHLLARCTYGDLSGFIRDFKNYTSKAFLKILDEKKESRRDWMKMVFEYHGKYKNKQSNQIWTHENHAEHIFSQKFIEQKLDYIHNNPIKAGIVANPQDYLYSSARNYADMESVIEIIKVDRRWITID
ncbi:MAG: transposase [Bacteroidales bacterium]|nr:transposase [Bacteroidales bacterium]